MSCFFSDCLFTHRCFCVCLFGVRFNAKTPLKNRLYRLIYVLDTGTLLQKPINSVCWGLCRSVGAAYLCVGVCVFLIVFHQCAVGLEDWEARIVVNAQYVSMVFSGK